MQPDQIVKGLLIGFASFAVFSFSDAAVKLIGGALPPVEIAFFGSALALLAIPFLMKPGDRWIDIFTTSSWKLWWLRFGSYAITVIGSVIAFSHLSMAEAFALIFLLPSFVTIMSVVFLKEHVGVKRWSAVIIGFVGVLIVLRPGFRELSIGHLGALIGGFCGAISIIIYRAAPASEKNIALFGAGILGALLICGVAMIPNYVAPTPTQWGILLGYGVLCALGNVLLMVASFMAPSAVIGPTQYSQMLWAILIDYLVFSLHLDLPMVIGIVLVIGSGVLTLWRERVRGTQLPSAIGVDGEAAQALKGEDDVKTYENA